MGKKIRTTELNNLISDIKIKHPPATTKKGVKPKIYYVTQTGEFPPQFTFFVNKGDYFHFSYKRYLENRIREKFGFNGAFLKLKFKNRVE